MSINQPLINAIRRRKEEGNVRSRPQPKPRFPHTVEREYNRQIRKYVRVFFDTVREVITPQLEMLVQQAASVRPDERLDAWPEEVERLIQATTIAFNESAPNLEVITAATANEVSNRNREQLNRSMRAVAGVDLFLREPYLETQLSSFRKENISLIKKISQTEKDAIEGIVQRGLQRGTSASEMGSEISKRAGIARRKADLIARDQVASLNGQLSVLRGQEIGVKKAIWITAGDERVRESHAARQGQEFELSKGIDGEFPGGPINCRCVNQLILDEVLDSV